MKISSVNNTQVLNQPKQKQAFGVQMPRPEGFEKRSKTFQDAFHSAQSFVADKTNFINESHEIVMKRISNPNPQAMDTITRLEYKVPGFKDPIQTHEYNSGVIHQPTDLPVKDRIIAQVQKLFKKLPSAEFLEAGSKNPPKKA